MNLISNIKPSKEERKFIDEVTSEVIKKLKKIKIIKPLIGGSISKDTWLKGTNEVDIYAKFDYKKFKDKNENISEFLYNELVKLFKVVRVHGSRDYFHVKYKGLTLEIVPILEVKKPEDALNVTDLSPMHINFVRKFPKLKDDIRLLKVFCKANYLYGAESYVAGFSGYAIEVLVIYYKSFRNVLKNATKWKKKTVIDFNKKLKNPLIELNPSKVVSPLIVIDPVDNNRNITSSLSLNSFNKFSELSRKYLEKPSEKFFVENKEIPKNAIVLTIEPLDGKKDIIGDKLVKVINFIKNELIKNEFEIKKNGWFWENKATFWFEVKNEKISPIYLRKGPPENMTSNVKDFLKKHKKVFVKNKIYYAEDKREFTHVKDFLKKLFKEEFIKERVQKISLGEK